MVAVLMVVDVVDIFALETTERVVEVGAVVEAKLCACR